MAKDQRKSRFTRICVFCGTNAGERPEYGAAARELGKLLADQSIELVYGGGGSGLMGRLSQGVLDGDLDGFIRAELERRARAARGGDGGAPDPDAED